MRFRSIQSSHPATHGNNRPSLLNRDVRSRILAHLDLHRPFTMPDLDETPPYPPPVIADEEQNDVEPLNRVIDWGDKERPLRVMPDLLPPTTAPIDSRRGGVDAVTRVLSPPSSSEGPSSGSGGITGAGSAGRITKWTGPTAIGNSVIYEVSGRIGVAQPSPAAGTALDVGGKAKVLDLRVAAASAATGKVWTATDATGEGDWQLPSPSKGFVAAMSAAL